MRKNLFICLLALLLSAGFVKAQEQQALKVVEHTLSNGMTIWLNEDHSQPKVLGAVVVNAGAKDCPNTGIAHYFEHIMFKGTDEIGTVDYAKEKPWLDSISICYDQLAATTDEAQRSEIQKNISRLSQKAAEYAIPNEFNSLISRYGGSNLNAGTSYDFTFYHNEFTPQYMEHWCQLNSDRLINPVFRLFQGELETVYEEKNMYSDNTMSYAMETVMKNVFGSQPYAYPVIGSTENLKNPKLSDMKEFYAKYYVGSNMGLVLSGDFDASTIIPLLEKTFGRIPKGTKPVRQNSPMPDITGERTVELKLPIPFISMEALVFKGPTDYEEDANAMSIAARLLTNGKAGRLDSLMNEGRVMAAAFSSMSLNDAGANVLLLVPKPLAKTVKAEAACLEQIKRLSEGDFTDEELQAQKLEIYTENSRELETLDRRAMKMVEVMSSGHSWKDYIQKVEATNGVTREDVIKASKRYLEAPFIRFVKKYGKYPKDKLTQPNYKPVVPKNRNAESEYAKRLAQKTVQTVQPRLLNLETDVTTTALGGQAMLYTTKNPVNDLFDVKISYNRGEQADPRLNVVCDMMNNIGTDSLTKQQLGNALQQLGADFSFSSDKESFTVNITGMDKNLEKTMSLIGNFFEHARIDDSARTKVLDALKSEEKSLSEENKDVLMALMEKALYGSRSSQLTRTTYKEAKALSNETMLNLFREVQGTACDIVYSGSRDREEVAKIVKETLPIDKSLAPYINYSKDLMAYNSPVVYVYDMPESRQTLFMTYDQVGSLPTQEERVPAKLLSQYFGGGMSSVLFQEVREFRSMAYTTGSRLLGGSLRPNPNAPLGFITLVGTQADKSMKAITLVDSLLHDMPVLENNFGVAKQELINDINNDFPSFRKIGSKIASLRRKGYTSDSNEGLADLYRKASFVDVQQFYDSHIKNHSANRVLCIVGSKKKLDLKELAKYGQVVFLKEKDLFKK